MSRFYGGTPWHWIAEAPLGLLRKVHRWMPRLTAEESLLAARQVGVGTGSFENAMDIQRQWKAQAHPQEVPATAHVERRAEAIRKAGVKVFGPKA